MTAPLCFLDTETTSLRPDRQAWEAAFIRRNGDGTETIEHFMLPVDLSTADASALRIGRFYDRHPTGQRLSHPTGWKTQGSVKPLAQAATSIARITHGAQLVGAVTNFDAEVLERLLRDQGLTAGWSYRLVCVETLASGHLRRNVGGLDRCAEALGLDPLPANERHTALGDAQLAKAIYDRVMTA